MGNTPPGFAEGVVYLVGENGNLYALDAMTGEQKWEYYANYHDLVEPMIIAHEVIYFPAGDKLIAIETETGREKWRFLTHGLINTPVMANGVIYFGTNRDYVYAVDVTDGTKVWDFKGKQPMICPAIANDTVYIGSCGFDKKLFALNAQTGQGQWKLQLDFCAGCPVVADDMIYVDGINSDL